MKSIFMFFWLMLARTLVFVHWHKQLVACRPTAEERAFFMFCFILKECSIALMTFAVHKLIYYSFAREESRVLKTSIPYSITLVHSQRKSVLCLVWGRNPTGKDRTLSFNWILHHKTDSWGRMAWRELESHRYS